MPYPRKETKREKQHTVVAMVVFLVMFSLTAAGVVYMIATGNVTFEHVSSTVIGALVTIIGPAVILSSS